MGDFAVGATVVSLGDIGGNQRSTAILARAAGDLVGACGVYKVGCGVGPRMVGAGTSRGAKGQWLRQRNWWAPLWPFGHMYQR